MRLKEDFFNLDKVRILAGEDNGEELIVILLKMYLKSLKFNGKLMFSEDKPYSDKSLSILLEIDENKLKNTIKKFKELDLIEVFENGIIYMNDIELFVGTSSTEAERKRLARLEISKQKQAEKKSAGHLSDICPIEIRDQRSESRDQSLEIRTKMINDKLINDKRIKEEYKKIIKKVFSKDFLILNKNTDSEDLDILFFFLNSLEDNFESKDIERAINYTLNRIPNNANHKLNYFMKAVENNLEKLERSKVKDEKLFS